MNGVRPMTRAQESGCCAPVRQYWWPTTSGAAPFSKRRCNRARSSPPARPTRRARSRGACRHPASPRRRRRSAPRGKARARDRAPRVAPPSRRRRTREASPRDRDGSRAPPSQALGPAPTPPCTSGRSSTAGPTAPSRWGAPAQKPPEKNSSHSARSSGSSRLPSITRVTSIDPGVAPCLEAGCGGVVGPGPSTALDGLFGKRVAGLAGDLTSRAGQARTPGARVRPSGFWGSSCSRFATRRGSHRS